MWIMCTNRHYAKAIGAQIGAQNGEDFRAQTGAETMLPNDFKPHFFDLHPSRILTPLSNQITSFVFGTNLDTNLNTNLGTNLGVPQN